MLTRPPVIATNYVQPRPKTGDSITLDRWLGRVWLTRSRLAWLVGEGYKDVRESHSSKVVRSVHV